MPEINIPREEPSRRPLPKGMAGQLGVIAVIVLILASLSTLFYKINPEEVGVIQRFGEYVRTTGPGFHAKLPFGIETCKKVPKEVVFTEEFGFKTKVADVETQYYSSREYMMRRGFRDSYSMKIGLGNDPFLAQSLILTGDLNCAEVEWAVLYRIKDPVAYSFNLRDVQSTIRDISEATMRQVVGDVAIDEILTTGKVAIQDQAKQLLQEVLDSYDVGIEVTNLKLQDVNPPREVKDSFNAVNRAMQEKERITNQARAAYNQVIPKMQGEAEQMISAAEGYALNRVNRAKGEADRFIATWEAYKEAKDVTKRRLYLEVMAEMLPNIDKKVILDTDGSGVLPLYNLTADETKGGVA